MNRIMPAALCFLFIAWVITQANLGNSLVLFNLINLIPFGDKVGHVMLYGLLSVLTIISFKYKSLVFKSVELPMGALTVFSFATIEEISQLFFVSRNFDVVDMFANTLGIYLSVWVTMRYKNKTEYSV